MSLLFTIFGVVLILFLGYLWVKKKQSFWKDRNVPYVKPKFLVGNLEGMNTKYTVGEILKNCYDDLKGRGPLGGIYFFTEPAVLIVDMDLLRSVFVKDFQHFSDRTMYVNERDDPLSAHLFSLAGHKWKNLRNKLTPTFTSGKMKMMHQTMLMVADHFKDHLLTTSKTEGVAEIEFGDILARFTTDIIGNVAFGVDCCSIADPQSEFRRIGRKIFEPSPWLIFVNVFTGMFPNASRALHLKLNSKVVTDFFLNLLKETIEYREQNNVQRNDFLSLLIQLKNDGKLEDNEEKSETLTFNELAAQLFLFFMAGFETSSSTMTFALYELALNADIQDKVREEIRQVLEEHNGVLAYDAAMQLKYLDQVIQETLRKYPVADIIIRTVTEGDYQVPNTEIVLRKGESVVVPVRGFHHDPEIYPNPDKFDPERFTKDNIAQRHPYAWIPFGKGPRDCIGMRFGMMQTRLGIATILNNFRLSPSGKTPIPIKFKVDAQLLTPEGGMFLNIERIL